MISFNILVDMINVVTFGDLNYERFWVSVSDRNTLVFSVRSCGHVTIALSSVMFNTRVQVENIDLWHLNNPFCVQVKLQSFNFFTVEFLAYLPFVTHAGWECSFLKIPSLSLTYIVYT